MVIFPYQPSITPITCKKRSLIHNQCYRNDYNYPSYFEYNGYWYKSIVKAGFEYDGASVPWITWTILRVSPDGVHRAATIGHDDNYIKNGVLEVECIGEMEVRQFDGKNILVSKDINFQTFNTILNLNRKEVDQIFLQQMLFFDVPEKKAKKMYRGVRLFGGLIRKF